MFTSPVLRAILLVCIALICWMLIPDMAMVSPHMRARRWILVGMLLVFAVALLAPRRFGWMFRVLAGGVFLSYVVYFGYEVWRLVGGEAQSFRPGRPSALMAGLGLLILGVPALVFALRGEGAAAEAEEMGSESEGK